MAHEDLRNPTNPWQDPSLRILKTQIPFTEYFDIVTSLAEAADLPPRSVNEALYRGMQAIHRLCQEAAASQTPEPTPASALNILVGAMTAVALEHVVFGYNERSVAQQFGRYFGLPGEKQMND